MTAESPDDEKIYYVYNIVLLVGSQQNCVMTVISNCFYQARAVTFKWYLKVLSCVLAMEWYSLKKKIKQNV